MHNLNILIVEDESLVAMELKQSISALGYNVVDYATNNAMAADMMQRHQIDLILMDINLHDTLNGIELYKSFQTKPPVIYLTAYADDATISQAVLTDPLGYLVKPHNDDELKALLKLAFYKMHHVNATPEAKEHRLLFGNGYAFDTQNDKLFFNDIYVKLSAKEMQLFKLLIDARGNFVSYNTIEHELWPDKIVHDSTLRALLYRLRGKLEYQLIRNEFDYGVKLER